MLRSYPVAFGVDSGTSDQNPSTSIPSGGKWQHLTIAIPINEIDRLVRTVDQVVGGLSPPAVPNISAESAIITYTENNL
jgi:hypothetical protein